MSQPDIIKTILQDGNYSLSLFSAKEIARLRETVFTKAAKDKETLYSIIELKKPRLKSGKNQLRSYCNATDASISVWTDGKQISHYHH